MTDAPTMALHALLMQLQWPRHALAEKGWVSWRLKGTPEGCLLQVTPTTLRAQHYLSESEDASLVRLEALWDIAPDAAPVLRHYVYAQEEQPLDASVAVQQFVETLALLNARPAFQTLGLRWQTL